MFNWDTWDDFADDDLIVRIDAICGLTCVSLHESTSSSSASGSIKRTTARQTNQSTF